MFLRQALETMLSSTPPRRSHGVSRITASLMLEVVALSFMTATVSAQIVDSTSLSVARVGHTGSRLQDGKILIVGGENASGALSLVEVYDSVTGTFALAASMGTRRADHTATLLADGRVLIAGGRQGDTALGSTEIGHRAARVQPGHRGRRRQQQRPVPEHGQGGVELGRDDHDGCLRLRAGDAGGVDRSRLAAG